MDEQHKPKDAEPAAGGENGDTEKPLRPEPPAAPIPKEGPPFIIPGPGGSTF